MALARRAELRRSATRGHGDHMGSAGCEFGGVVNGESRANAYFSRPSYRSRRLDAEMLAAEKRQRL